MENRGSTRSGDFESKKRPQNREQNDEIEVLFEWREHRSIIKSKRSQLLDKVTDNFICLAGQSDVQVHTLKSSRQARGKEKKYLLQRYVQEWKAYINLDTIEQVKNRDCVTIVQQSFLSAPSSKSPYVTTKVCGQLLTHVYVASYYTT